MRRFIAFLLRWEVVWLRDYNGEMNCRLARRTSVGLMAWRMSRFFHVGQVLCLPDGTTAGPTKYVDAWWYA